ncbi:MAG TPA: Ig-like domain-containing protein [Pedomonas sp.]|uniref:Ig-like domain-containing protein n=1 Tax=Pedomonas sp. TaxID=2976421 RepID=UPI002F40F3FD
MSKSGTVVGVTGKAWARGADGSLRVLSVGDELLGTETLILASGSTLTLNYGSSGSGGASTGEEAEVVTFTTPDNGELTIIRSGQGMGEALPPELVRIAENARTPEDSTRSDDSQAPRMGDGYRFVELVDITRSPETDAIGPLSLMPIETAVRPMTIAWEGAPAEAIEWLSSNARPATFPVNRAPEAAPDIRVVKEDGIATGNVLQNDADPENNTLAVTQFEIGGRVYSAGETAVIAGVGSLVLSADGSYSFTPVADWNGAVPAILYTINDGRGGTAASTLQITVEPVADITADVVATHAGEAVTLDVLGNDTFENGSAAVSAVTQGAHGTTVLNPDGTITYTPNAGYVGPDSYTYTVLSGGISETTTVTVDVTNAAPIAAPDHVTTPEDTALSGNVLGNDSDADGDQLAVTQFEIDGEVYLAGQTAEIPGLGTLTLKPSGDYTFTPDQNWNGTVPVVTYTVTDGNQGGTTTATLIIEVTPVNDAPIAGGLPGRSDADADVIEGVDVKAGFADIEGDTLTYWATGLPAGLTLDPATGLISGTIDASASQTGTTGNPLGTYTVIITADDGHGGTATQNFTWTVANPAPEAVDDINSTTEDTAFTVSAADGVLGNDSDVDGDALTVSAVNGNAASVGAGVAGSNGGTFNLKADGSYDFDPNGQFEDLAVGETRTTSITYRVSDGKGGTDTATLEVTVTGVNDAPEAVASLPTRSSLDLDAIVDLDITTAFRDVDASDALTYTATGLPLGLTLDPTTGLISGTIDNSASQSGTIGNPAGAYTVTITADDGHGGTATQDFIWVVANPAPNAADDLNITNEDTALVVNAADGVLGNDSDPDGDALSVSAVNGDAGSVGTSVAGSNGGTFTLKADGSYDFDPSGQFEDLAVGETRTTSITYTVSDGEGGTDTATLTVTVTGRNDAPEAVASLPAQSSFDADGVTNLDITAAFTDVDASDTLTYSAAGLPLGLTLDPATGLISGTIDNSASQTGTPGSPAGTYMVVITANDGHGGTATQTFTWIVANPSPIASDDLNTTNEDTPLIISAADGVLGNDSDPDGDAIAVSAVNAIAGNVGASVAGSNGGTFTLKADGSYEFDPNGQFEDLAVGETRTTSITYTVSDGEGGTDTATLEVTVTGVNDAPKALDDINTTSEDAPLAISAANGVPGNDSDVDGDALTVSAVNGNAADVDATIAGSGGGTFTLKADGSYDFDPSGQFEDLAVDETRTTSITYRVGDGKGGMDTATLTVTVTGANDAPETVASLPAQSSLDADAIANIDVTSAFADVDASDTLTYSATGLPAGLTLDPTTGLISGTIDNSASQSGTIGNPAGTYTVVITADDGHGGRATQNFTWVVANPAPEAKADHGSVTEDGPDLVVSAANGVIGSAATPAGADNDPDGDALSVTHVINGTASGLGDFSGAANAGVQITGTYGTLTLNADGSYTYILDNSNPIVNGLDGTSAPLADVFSYAISDGEGGRAFTSLTITINGNDDGAPAITPVDGNGIAAGQMSVHEAGLTSNAPAGQHAAANGTITLSASNGLASITIGGATLTLAHLKALSAGSPVEIDTDQGKLTLTGYASSSETGGISTGGTLSYTYTLEKTVANPDAASTNHVENIALSVKDVAGQTSASSLGVNIIDDAPSIGAPVAATVSEANLASGTNPDTGALTQTGSLGIRTGADSGSVETVFDAAQEAPSGLTSNGMQLVYAISSDGHTLTATANGDVVFIVTLTNPGTAAAGYSFELVRPLDHGASPINLSFGFTVTDADGDTASASFQISVLDDGPIAQSQAEVSLAEGGVSVGSESVGQNLLANDKAGADGSAKVISITYLDETGSQKTADVLAGGTTVDTQYGSLTVHPDGRWSYTSDATEYNPAGVRESFDYTIEDGDKTQSTATQSLKIDDTNPTVDTVALSLDEKDISGTGSGTGGTPVATVDLEITKGADAISDVVFDAATVKGLADQNLTSGGTALTYTLSNNGHTLTAAAGGTPVFTLTLNNPSDGTGASQSVTMTLTGKLDHNTPSTHERLSIPVSYTVSDTDSSITASLNLTVVDDVPTAYPDTTPVSVAEGGGAVTGALLLDNDAEGADGAHVWLIQYTDGAGVVRTGQVQDRPEGSTFETNDGRLTVHQDGTWSFTPKASLDHSDADNDAVNFTFQYELKDGDGDVSGWASQTVTINDTAPSIGTPDTDTLNEANLPSGTNPNTPALTQTGSLAILKAADGIDVTFNGSQTALQALNLTSGGTALTYTVSANGHTLTATAGAGGPVVFTATIENPAAANASYKFVLARPLDHGNGEEIALPIAYGVADADGDTAGSSFTIKVLDDQPETTRTFTLNEDSAGVTFNTSADASPSNLAVSNPAHGTVTVNANGTLTYKPQANFSGTDTFTYTTTADDGNTLSTTVTVVVNPVSDAPQLTVDAATIQTSEDTAIALGLNAPVVVDATDRNGAGTPGDNPELLGAITLSGIPAGAQLLDESGNVLFTSVGNAITIQLSDGDHIAGLSPTLTLTKAQFEALQILPAAESHSNFTVTVRVTSYEVGDNDLAISGVAGIQTSRTVKVNVQAVTDPVELSLKDGSDADGLATDHTFAEDTSFNLADLLTVSFGSTDGNAGPDTDGSEERWFEISGLPIGTTVNSVTVTAENPTVTVAAPGLSTSPTGLPAMVITPPLNFSGDVTITVTLKAQDRDADGIGAGATKGAVEQSSVTLNLHVTPVGGDVTASDVSMTEDASAAFLSGIAVTDGGGAGSEIITQVEFEVPAGWTVSETGSTTGYTTSIVGTTYTISFDASLTQAGREAVLDGFRIAAPGNSSTDRTIDIKVTTADTVSINGSDVTQTTTTTLPVKVTVTPVAETVGGDSNADGIDDVTMTAGHSYTSAGAEDTWFTLGTASGFNLKDGWSNQDGDEQLFARLTPELIAGDGGASDAKGAQFRYSTNGDTSENGGAWVTVPYNGTAVNIPAAYLDTLQFKAPKDLSGSFKIKVEAYTLDADPDTGTTAEAISGSAVLSNLIIDPVADDVTVALNARIAGIEDTSIPLNIRPTSSDPSETFTVTISNIPAGAQLYYDGVLQTVTAGSVTIQEFDASKPLALQPPHNSNKSFTLGVSAHSVDGSDISDAQNLTVEVSLRGVADAATLTPIDTTYSEAALDSGSDQVLLKELLTISLDDNDTSEVLTLRVTGLPEGFSLTEGTMLVDGTGANRVWLLTQQQFNTAQVTTPANFSGTQSLTVIPVTTENDGNALTGSPTTVKITVTPSTEATATTSATLDEDTLTPLGLGIVHQNGDTDETLTRVWIATDDADSANFTLYLGTTKLSAAGLDIQNFGGQDYYVLTNAQIGQLAAKGASNLDGPLGSFDFKYEVTDARFGAISAGTSNATVHDATFELTANPVTDQVDVSIIDIRGSAGTTLVSDAHTGDDAALDTASLTAGDRVTVTLNIATVSDAGSAAGTADADGSETVIRVIIEGVPDGVSVEGAEYNGGGTWLLIYDGTDALPINSTGGINLPVVFDVGGYAADLNSVPITMEVQTQDRGNQPAETAIRSDTVVWHLSTDFAGGEGPIPAHIVKWDYTNAHATEDAVFLLSDMIEAQVEVADPSVANTFTVSLMDVPPGTSIEGMRMTIVNGEEVWTAAVTVLDGGDANAALQSLLQGIKVTPPANSNENNTAGGFNFDASLTVSVPGGIFERAIIEGMTVPVDPVTDAGIISISATTINEGVESIPVTITVSNDADGAFGTITDGKLYVKVDVAGSTNGLENGTLTYNGSALLKEMVGGVEYYVVTGVTAGAPINLVYTPDNSTAGQVSFSALVRTQEAGSNLVQTGIASGTAEVAMINNGVTVSSAPSSGNESNPVQISGLVVDLIDKDGSENIQFILLSNVPNGFLVYVGDSAETATLASNAGSDTWVISKPDGSLPAYVAIVPPEHWSGTLENLSVMVASRESAFREGMLQQFDLADVVINPVADGVELAPTSSFGPENQVIRLNLNASMADAADASVPGAIDANQETTTLKLTGLGEFASFYIGSTERTAGVSYDAGTDIYTLTNLTQSDLDQLGFLQARSALTDQNGATAGIQIRVEACTTDGASTSTSDTDYMTVNPFAQMPTSGNDTLKWTGNTIDAGDGIDTVHLRKGESLLGSELDSKLSNVEVLDLHGNEITSLTAADVLGITGDSSSILTILGDGEDSLTLGTGWASAGTQDIGGIDYAVYTATIGATAVELHVQSGIPVD